IAGSSWRPVLDSQWVEFYLRTAWRQIYSESASRRTVRFRCRFSGHSKLRLEAGSLQKLRDRSIECSLTIQRRICMACKPEVLKSVPLFALLDDDETAVLASQVEVKTFGPRERIYKMGGADAQGYVMISGKVRVTTVDEDQQEVVVDEPGEGEF